MCWSDPLIFMVSVTSYWCHWCRAWYWLLYFVFVFSLSSSHLSEAGIIQGFISSFRDSQRVFISFLFYCFFPFVSFVLFFKYLCVFVCVCVCVFNCYFTRSLHRSLENRSPALSFLMCVFMAIIVLVLMAKLHPHV